MLFRINQVCIYVYVLFNAQFKHDLGSFNVLPEKILLHGTIHTLYMHVGSKVATRTLYTEF